MMENFNENELQVASKLIFDGLSMAKSSMEQILQSPITIQEIQYGEKPNPASDSFYSGPVEKVHLIKTDLIGEIKGVSYLIFSETEVRKICKACLPPNILENDTPEGQMMILGFLSEIDNMVSAAVITEFSNFLGLDIYGGVPSMEVMESVLVDETLKKRSTGLDSIIHFKAIFHGKELDIAPDFVWILQNEFVDRIKKII
jgi:chemotaxis protein CheY-P-specific phosphatase CheC